MLVAAHRPDSRPTEIQPCCIDESVTGWTDDRYRDLLRSYAPDLVFVHLAGSAETIGARMDARAHEFMPRTLLESQFAALEELAADEAHVLGDITQTLDVLVEAVARQLEAGAPWAPADPGCVPEAVHSA